MRLFKWGEGGVPFRGKGFDHFSDVECYCVWYGINQESHGYSGDLG